MYIYFVHCIDSFLFQNSFFFYKLGSFELTRSLDNFDLRKHVQRSAVFRLKHCLCNSYKTASSKNQTQF